MPKKLKVSHLLAFILGGLIIGSIGVYAGSILLGADQVQYNDDKTVQGAIEELYGLANNCDSRNVAEIGNATGATIDTASASGKTYKAIVYLDPTDLTRECNATNSASNFGKTNQKDGCMRWYAYNTRTVNSKTVYDLILDHNSTATVAWANQTDYLAAGGTADDWSNSKYNMLGPITINKELEKLTRCKGFGGNEWQVKPRMITADEIAHIVGADSSSTIKWSSIKSYGTTISTQSSWFYLDGGRNSSKTTYSETNGWQKQYATSQGTSNYAWLYNYTTNCTSLGCDVPDNVSYSGGYIYGYWTSTKINDSVSNVWFVGRGGGLNSSNYASYSSLGLRPVISITK